MTTANSADRIAIVSRLLGEGGVVPFLGPGVFDLVEGPCAVPRSSAELVAAVTATAAVPGRIRTNLTQSCQYIESHRHRRAFDDAFGREPMSKAETEDLREFYEAFREGTLGGPEDDYPEE